MFLTMGDLGTLKIGDTARGAFTAALPKPPIRHHWVRIPGTGETPPGGGLSTYLYRLERYEEDPPPIDVSKLVKSEAELVAEANAADTELQKMVADIEEKEQRLAVEKAAAADQARKAAALSIASRGTPQKPWYKRPVIVGSIVGGALLTGLVVVFLVER